MRAEAVRTWAAVGAVRARVMPLAEAVRAWAVEAHVAAVGPEAVGDELRARMPQSIHSRVRTKARLRAARGIWNDRLR